MPLEAIKKLRKEFHVFAACVALLYVVVISLSAVTYAANQHRIDDVNKSRESSCRQTYEGVREVFRPFLTPERQRTKEQQQDAELFNKTIDELVANCDKQINERE